MARKDLTTFLIALNDSIKLRDKWRDPDKKEQLLQQWGLEDEPSLQGDGDVELMKEKVRAETGSKQVEWWIRSAGEPVLNQEYNPDA